MPVKRLTGRQLADKERLNALWQAYQARTQKTQDQFSAEVGWSQGGFNHYLTGRKPLGIKAVIKIASHMDVHPAEISPELVAEHLHGLLGPDERPVLAEPSGTAYTVPAISPSEAAIIYEGRRLAEKLRISPDELADRVIKLMRILVVTPVDDSRLEPAWDASTKPPPVPAR